MERCSLGERCGCGYMGLQYGDVASKGVRGKGKEEYVKTMMIGDGSGNEGEACKLGSKEN